MDIHISVISGIASSVSLDRKALYLICRYHNLFQPSATMISILIESVIGALLLLYYCNFQHITDC